ncbi:hypothetical protein V5738_06920 [Salinisphaera sp. SPP-AMP-43]|uniref:hypothetical protein n=1 Tax=Salinisphaera sp. SPP-AMP-43 TaxID=3121288 RepID=UPI003C6DDAAD
MGWLFAVSNGLQAGRAQAVWSALLPLTGGHVLAMAVVLLPAAVLRSLAIERPVLQIGAAALLISFGVYKFMRPRHPRALARIGPKRLMLWSFLMASAHGAGLMLVPIYLAATSPSHHTMTMPADTLLALAMVAIHTAAMLAAAGIVAWVIYRYLGLRWLRATWIDTDRIWAGALIFVGLAALAV